MDAVDTIFTQHRPLALRRAARYARHCDLVPLDDLEAAALVGLWDAAKRYRPERHTAFATFARRRIDGEIVDWVRRLDRLPRSLHYRRDKLRHISLERTLGCGDNAEPLRIADLLVDAATSPAAVALRDETDDAQHRQRQELRHCRDRLSWRGRLILRLFYDEGFLLREIAETLGVCPSRLSQLFAEIHARMRE